MKTSLLLTFVMMMLGVTLRLVLAGADHGYTYVQPLGEQLDEIQRDTLPRKHRVRPRGYPEFSYQNCGDPDEVDYAAALATYHANRPQLRRIYNHQEVQVDSSFFEPSLQRIKELKRILLDQQ
ncbi:uncharacterized protein LOC123037527 [Drosophila rhopaloa]|uniref:Uncharacterized protein n=1 Tax=Drosophila rhopaloa TaxID=1041015 RepID=A0ABM5J735_DRORH|nr:uncharacterized protein LOC123037527 [Drosophila rhopaloa]